MVRSRGWESGWKEEARRGRAEGNPGGKRKTQEGGGAGWESGGKGKPPRKKKRILKGEVKNLGNLPIKKVRTSMMEGKEGEAACERAWVPRR